MRYYPVCLDIKNRKCLVVGGGAVGTRKVEGLLKCGGVVSVISESFTERLQSLSEKGAVELLDKVYNASDLEEKFLVIGATDDQVLNKSISKDAESRNMMCNIADFPEACNFILPSVVNRGDLTIAISTSGKSPAFAKKLRKELSDQFGEEYAGFLFLMGEIRKKLLSEKHEPEAHKPLFEKLLNKGLLELTKSKDKDGIDTLLNEVLGPGFRYDDLTNP